jgi:hypothetical protein
MARELESLFGVPIGIEGLYPDRSQTWLMSTWGEYRWVMESGTPYALDLSHLNIVSRDGRDVDEGLLRDLITNPGCMEIHVSDNDGHADRHWIVSPRREPFWAPVLADLAARHRLAPIFSESWRQWPGYRAADDDGRSMLAN